MVRVAWKVRVDLVNMKGSQTIISCMLRLSIELFPGRSLLAWSDWAEELSARLKFSLPDLDLVKTQMG